MERLTSEQALHLLQIARERITQCDPPCKGANRSHIVAEATRPGRFRGER